jgi:glycosyltransferase involved in cell wall biosynthesis
MERPVGPAVYATFVLGLLERSDEIELLSGREAGRADVVLCLDGRFRVARSRRTVTAVLDLGHLFERGGYGRREWLEQNWRVASAVRRSDHLLAPSEAVRFGLERYLRVPADRITVLAPTPPPDFRRPPRAEVDEVRSTLRLPPAYFLFVGTRSRRKNLGLLAEAWRAAAGRLPATPVLVLAGPGSGGVPGALDLGYVAAHRLPALIAGAVALVNPSLYEGSALGVQEAMACGTPALVAGTGAMPRAVGMAGLILDPHDVAQWAQALEVVARDDALRSRLGVAGLKAAAELRASGPGPALAAAAIAGARGAVR